MFFSPTRSMATPVTSARAASWCPAARVTVIALNAVTARTDHIATGANTEEKHDLSSFSSVLRPVSRC